MATVPALPAKKERSPRERIDVRLRPEQKSRIEKAAGIKGVSVTDFIIQNALENATRAIRDFETWTLERDDAEAFFAALLSPPKAGTRLMRAAKRYKKRYLQDKSE